MEKISTILQKLDFEEPFAHNSVLYNEATKMNEENWASRQVHDGNRSPTPAASPFLRNGKDNACSAPTNMDESSMSGLIVPSNPSYTTLDAKQNHHTGNHLPENKCKNKLVAPTLT